MLDRMYLRINMKVDTNRIFVTIFILAVFININSDTTKYTNF